MKKARPPIVVVVGHVDHGKTALLDYIRKTNVVAREAGGITQSIGAYEVEHKKKKITFIDTPGHEAFTKMRAQGARAADIAILVVSAEEGVKPQTQEAIDILKKTQTPFIVALTKVDKPTADVTRVKNDLLNHEVLLEGMGGDVSFQAVSSKSGEGIEELLDLILLLSEVLETSCDLDAPARGFIIEACRNSKRGIEAHVVVLDGTLREGTEIRTRTAIGRVKALENFLGKRAKTLEPSAPALIIGFETIPEVGEEFVQGGVELLAAPSNERRGGELGKPVESRLSVTEDGKLVSVVLKADTSGTLAALEQLVTPLAHVVERSVGDISDGDIQQAISTSSIILGFQVKMGKPAENLAKIHGVQIFTENIIYKLIEQLEKHIKVLTGPVAEGELLVLRVFGKKGDRQIIGGRVTMGIVKSSAEANVMRADKLMGGGRIVNLQKNKADALEAKEGDECGMLFEGDVEVKEGDTLKVLVREQ